MTVPGEQATSAFMEPGYRINLLFRGSFYVEYFRSCCYLVLTALFAPCMAFFAALNFACLAFNVSNKVVG